MGNRQIHIRDITCISRFLTIQLLERLSSPSKLVIREVEVGDGPVTWVLTSDRLRAGRESAVIHVCQKMLVTPMTLPVPLVTALQTGSWSDTPQPHPPGIQPTIISGDQNLNYNFY